MDNSIKVKNQTGSPLFAVLSQLAPLQVMVIQPGETQEFSNLGRVHYTVSVGRWVSEGEVSITPEQVMDPIAVSIASVFGNSRSFSWHLGGIRGTVTVPDIASIWSFVPTYTGSKLNIPNVLADNRVLLVINEQSVHDSLMLYHEVRRITTIYIPHESNNVEMLKKVQVDNYQDLSQQILTLHPNSVAVCYRERSHLISVSDALFQTNSQQYTSTNHSITMKIAKL